MCNDVLLGERGVQRQVEGLRVLVGQSDEWFRTIKQMARASKSGDTNEA